jgi:mono/diheme cytochrome c family protein
MTIQPLILLLAGAGLALGDGKTDYNTYCAACHAPDGLGASNGTFPPLAESPWVVGDPSRAIKVVLHGLHGPVTVGDKTFNLEMPPQGAVLKDEQIAGILTYVRSSWGNKQAAVSPGEVAAIRSAFSKRETAWTGEELDKLHPLPETKPAIKHLISRVYHGEWQKLPDFQALQAKSIEEEHTGRISASQSDRKNNYGIVWDGELTIPEAGNYVFELQVDDGAAVYIEGQEILRVDGIGPLAADRSRTKTIPLTQGDHKIRIDYFEATGEEGIFLRFRKDGTKNWVALSEKPTSQGKVTPRIPITPNPGEAVMYRNFIEDVSPRAIGVGYDGGVNLAFSADNLNVSLIWTGAFIDGGKHWTDRGQGNQKPSGENVVRLGNVPGYAKLSAPDASWPKMPQEAGVPFHFRGYRLNKAQQPTFLYHLGEVEVTDESIPEFGEGGQKLALNRTITFTNPGSSPLEVSMLLAQGKVMAGSSTGSYVVGDNTTLVIEADVAAQPVLRDSGKQLVLPLSIQPGTSKISLKYQW